jgi:hypothetical protein
MKYYNEIPSNNEYTFKNEGREWKTGVLGDGYQWKGGGWMERDEGCEYSLGTLYAYMKIEQ